MQIKWELYPNFVDRILKLKYSTSFAEELYKELVEITLTFAIFLQIMMETWVNPTIK